MVKHLFFRVFFILCTIVIPFGSDAARKSSNPTREINIELSEISGVRVVRTALNFDSKRKIYYSGNPLSSLENFRTPVTPTRTGESLIYNLDSTPSSVVNLPFSRNDGWNIYKPLTALLVGSNVWGYYNSLPAAISTALVLGGTMWWKSRKKSSGEESVVGLKDRRVLIPYEGSTVWPNRVHGRVCSRYPGSNMVGVQEH